MNNKKPMLNFREVLRQKQLCRIILNKSQAFRRTPIRIFSTSTQADQKPEKKETLNPRQEQVISQQFESVLSQERPSETPKINSTIFNALDEITRLSCNGCGAKIQYADPYNEGYADLKVVTQYLEGKHKGSSERLSALDEEIQTYLRNSSSRPKDSKDPKRNHSLAVKLDEEEPDFEDVDKKFFANFWKQKSIKALNCLRCQRIKSHKIDEIMNIETGIKRELSRLAKRKAFVLDQQADQPGIRGDDSARH